MSDRYYMDEDGCCETSGCRAEATERWDGQWLCRACYEESRDIDESNEQRTLSLDAAREEEDRENLRLWGIG